jgi:chromate reductase
LIAAKIVALTSSLRAALTNGVWLCGLAAAAGRGFIVKLVLLGSLQLINLDVDAYPPDLIHRFHTASAAADAVIVASPDYAHGIANHLKNELERLVKSARYVRSPLLISTITPRAIKAFAAPHQTLATMAVQFADGIPVVHHFFQTIRKIAVHAAHI